MSQTPPAAPSPEPSDEELWRRFVDGDDAAIRDLVERHSGELYRYLLVSTGRPDEAGRHVIGTWGVLCCYRRAFEGFGSFRAWLYAVATQRWVPAGHPEQFGLGDLLDELRHGRPTSREGRVFMRVKDMHRVVRQPFLLETLAGLELDQVAAACRFTRERARNALSTAYRRLGRGALFGDSAGTDSASRAAIAEEVRRAVAVEVPEELDGLVERAVREAIEGGEALRRPPADPTPERSGAQRAAVVVVAMVLFTLGSAGLLALLAGRAEPVPPVASPELVAGRAEVRAPGAGAWREMASREFLPPGAQVRTGPDACLVLRGEQVEWWLPPMTAVALPDRRSAELLAGRLYARVEAGPPAPGRLVSQNGTVVCAEGEFVARVTPRRIIVGCVSGAATLEGQQPLAELAAGELTMATEGEHAGPVRAVRPAQLTHWLAEFDLYEGRRLEGRQIAAVPLAPPSPSMPPGVRLDRLAVALTVRGPLAAVEARATVINEGDEPWEGALELAPAVLPPPLVAAAGEGGRLAPGQEATLRAAGAFLMRNRNERYALGIAPGAWTRDQIGRLEVSVRAEADGGVRHFDCPTLGGELRRPGQVHWTARRDRADPAHPLVFEFRFGEAEGTDVMAGATGAGPVGLAAWRPPRLEDGWIGRDRNVFIAFDATAEFGSGGRAAAQDVLEGLLNALPPGCSTAVLGYDGRLQLDPDRLRRHHPDRVEAMISGFWQLEPQEEGADGGNDFLSAAMALAAGAEGEGLLLFVTGRGGPVPAPAGPGPGDELRVCVLQVGADEADAAYASLCAGTGGVALALPGAASPELAVLDFLANLEAAALRRAAFGAPGARAGVLLLGAGRFSNQPVAALLALPQGAGQVSGRFTARAAERDLEARFAAEMPGSGELPRSLAEALWRRHTR